MSAQNTHRLTLEDLAVLNDEICALTRAKLPLELGLKSAASSLGRQLAAVVDTLANQLAAGATLEQALDQQQQTFPPVYRALVTAGLKTGRLDQALESLSGFSRTLEELRQKIGLALIYPTIVLALAWALWSLFLVSLFPTFDTVLTDFGAGDGLMQRILRTASVTMPFWVPALPLGLLVAGSSWWMSRKWLLQPANSGPAWHPGRVSASMLRRLPWIGSILMNFHRANFTELLAMLLEYEVPLGEAVPLAIDASGDPQLAKHRKPIIDSLEAGCSLSEVLQSAKATTPFVRWMIDAAQGQGQGQGGGPRALQAALIQASTILKRRADYQAEWFQLAFPILMLAVVGGGAVLVYSLSLFLPVIDLLDALSQP
jgi:general secretion pathway protein F